MTTAIAMLAVGLVSYVFRVVPLLTVGRLRLGPGVLRTIRHGGAAAVTALFVTSLGGGAHGSSDPALIIAAGASLWVAVRGAAMLRIVLFGAAAYALVVVPRWLVQVGSS
jgi:branched-subunit amino acid transport protein